MKRILFVVIFCCFVCIVAMADEGIAGVKMLFPEKDLGIIANDMVVRTHFFVVSNENIFVRIEKIEVSCGCIEVVQQRDFLKPKERVRLDVTIIPSRGKLGENQWYVRVFTSSKKTPVLFDTFKATVLQNDIISTRDMDLGNVPENDMFSNFIWLKLDNKSKILHCKQQFSVSRNVFDIQYEKGICEVLYPGAQMAYCIKLRIAENFSPQRIVGDIIIVTDDPKHKEIKVRISLIITKPNQVKEK